MSYTTYPIYGSGHQVYIQVTQSGQFPQSIATVACCVSAHNYFSLKNNTTLLHYVVLSALLYIRLYHNKKMVESPLFCTEALTP